MEGGRWLGVWMGRGVVWGKKASNRNVTDLGWG